MRSEKVITALFEPKGQAQMNKWNELDKLITLLQNQPDDDGYFIYLNPSNANDPYDLIPLTESDTSKKDGGSAAIQKKASAA